MSTTIPEMLARTVNLYSHKTAVAVPGGTRLTYGELWRRGHAVASGLRSLGVGPGDRVAVTASNGITHFDVYVGCAIGGSIAVPISSYSTRDEVGQILEDATPKLVIADPGHGDTVAGAMRDDLPLVSTESSTYRHLTTGDVTGPSVSVQPGQIAQIIYTSGTTGLPKGVCLSHAALVFNAYTLLLSQQLVSDDVFLSTTPLNHVAAGSRVTTMLVDGQTHVTLPKFSTSAFEDAVEEFQATTTILVPTQLARLLRDQQRLATLRSLRLIVYGAAPSGEALVARAVKELDCPMHQGYGLTEAVTNLTGLTPEDHRVALAEDNGRLSSCGRAVVGVVVAIRGADGRALGPGENGEVWIRTPKLMEGYWHKPAETEQALHDGWLRTGDMGRLDEDGYLYLMGREGDMIITGGVNIYPAEIERVLLTSGRVADAVVIGVPDPEWGEVPVAFVETGVTGPSEEELLALLRTRLSGVRVPRRIVFRSQLPRTATGKVRRSELREALDRDRETRETEPCR